MVGLKRNQTAFWYCLYRSDRIPGDTATVGNAVSGVTMVGDDEENVNYIIDTYGNEDGETIPQYADAVRMVANISPATGQNQVEQFGNLDSYDKVIVTCDMSCPIDENTVLFIDKEPEYTEVRTNDVTESQALYGEDEITERVYRIPKYNYIVKRVAKSLNSISIAVRKVEVG